MAKRYKMPARQNRNNFRHGTRVHRKNNPPLGMPMRGGIRL